MHLIFDGSKRTMDESIFTMLSAWAEQSEKLRSGEITKEQYDHGATHSRRKIPPSVGQKYRRRDSVICL